MNPDQEMENQWPIYLAYAEEGELVFFKHFDVASQTMVYSSRYAIRFPEYRMYSVKISIPSDKMAKWTDRMNSQTLLKLGGKIEIEKE